ncbi:helix-turn-helix domain-containing protein [Jhaorihella thermophila]|uniref:helix-turn-helix domain-containing protein n=1 Tax=Jhaorihella thermophila TaxID=488547 RepID=UPI000CDE5CE8|nr:helix-turn-helix transcriptional regulator [Jhaorihella thermophila]
MKIKTKEVRIAKGVSQTELAKRTGLSRPYLSQLESGVRNLSARHQAKIAEPSASMLGN